jgi:hypothetical protein
MGLTLWILWIDDCLLLVGSRKNIKNAKQKMINWFDCDVIGNMNKYVCYKLELKVNWKERWIRFTQHILLQSYSDEFDLGKEAVPSTPADLGTHMMP